MKSKYITTQILLACLSRPAAKKDIHAQLQETIDERKRILCQLQNISRAARVIDLYVATQAA